MIEEELLEYVVLVSISLGFVGGYLLSCIVYLFELL